MDVIVIGGGLAGLAAAERLVAAGASVTLLEARDRLGGRVWSEGSDGGCVVELGAEWIGDEGELHDMLTGAGAHLLPAEGRQVQRTGRGWEDLSERHRDAQRLVRRIQPNDGDRSLRASLAECCTDAKMASARDHLLRYVEGFHAADPDRLSVRWLAEVERTQPAEASEHRAVEGAALAVDVLRRRLERGCDVRLDTVVKWVRWRTGAVGVETAAGSTLHAAAAVITVPLPLLDPSTDEPAALRIEPRIESRLAAARLLHMGPVVKVVLAFARPFWHEVSGLEGTLFLHTYERPVPTWWLPVDSSVALLTGWAGGPYAARLAGMAHDTLAELAAASAADALGVPRAVVTAELRGFHFHSWSADPYTRGAYTYVGVGGAEAHRTLAAPVDRTLFFAGEATCGGGYNATMEGALRSGRRAAAELLET